LNNINQKNIKKELSVVDFFCGAGGFSEGFRQQGFKNILGIDNWQPAINTYNHNYKHSFKTKDILDFYDNIEDIHDLPNSDVILGSPPCVSFSSSNKSGKADKSLGLKLTESFLRVVTVKKFQKSSTLKAWFMENVENSKKHLKDKYSFSDLNLKDWAKENGINPESTAINIADNNCIINSADYGSYQSRKRLISGELIHQGKLIIPKKTHSKNYTDGLELYKTLGVFKKSFPNPFFNDLNKNVIDPTYNLELKAKDLTDHFYDTGIYESEWESSKFLKTNHPFMGKMSFPENELNPSRTVTATKIANSRESIIYKSEVNRKGNGEYRTPTVREVGCLMGFPISYQFLGSEHTKWRLVGNAVCPSVSRALARVVREELNCTVSENIIESDVNIEEIFNLNNFNLKEFNNPPKKNKGARFRRHPFKTDNITVALSNYDVKINEKLIGNWRSTVFYGTGDGFGIDEFPDGFFKKLEPVIINEFLDGKRFIKLINNGFSSKVASKDILQDMYEKQTSVDSYYNPIKLIEELKSIIDEFDQNDEMFIVANSKVFKKEKVSKKQLYALYAINKIVSITNNKN
jgi:DNA (cytosine-5)-methyltransferase 1